MLKFKEVCALLAGIAVTAAAVQLGNWQSGRAKAKQSTEMQMRTAEALPPLPPPEKLAQLPQALWYRKVQLRGHWRPELSIFLDNRPLKGNVGYHVVTPLQLASGEHVLINRGWVQKRVEAQGQPPRLSSPAGEIQIEGQIVAALGHFWEFQTESAKRVGTVWNNISVADYRSASGLEVAPFFVLQTSAASDGLVRTWDRPASQVGKHKGYAFQWYALALLSAVLTLYFGCKRVFRSSTTR